MGSANNESSKNSDGCRVAYKLSLVKRGMMDAEL